MRRVVFYNRVKTVSWEAARKKLKLERSRFRKDSRRRATGQATPFKPAVDRCIMVMP